MAINSVTNWLSNYILPLSTVIIVTPLFFLGWFTCLILGFFVKTRPLFYRLDNIFWSAYQRLILHFVENGCNTDLHLYGDVPDNKRRENVILICNHQGSFDWIIADILAIRHGCLGNIRYVLKNSLRYIPLFGYFFKIHGCIYVNRGLYDANSYKAQIKKLIERGIYWLVIFPEGTRYKAKNKVSIEASRRFAEKHGLPIFDVVLTPRHRGCYHALQQLDGSCDAIYDITTAYEPRDWVPDGNQPPAPSMIGYLSGSISRLHIHLKRIPVSEIPKEESAFIEWLCERFRIKNEMLKKFYSSGGSLLGDDLPAPSKVPAFPEALPHVFLALVAFLFLIIQPTNYFILLALGVVVTVGWMALVQ